MAVVDVHAASFQPVTKPKTTAERQAPSSQAAARGMQRAQRKTKDKVIRLRSEAMGMMTSWFAMLHA